MATGDEGDPLLDGLRLLTRDPSAEFRPGQREAITALVEERRRVLLVQRTGWGKSAVYFLATHLLRREGLGPTLLVSPLLALMRNQLEAARRLGIEAATVNSGNQEDWAEIAERMQADQIDLLLVSPERLANAEFLAWWTPVIARRPGLIVVDEVHCISDWGHDFRPDYRRMARILDNLPATVPVLGCTATANDRVVDDVATQLGTDLLTLRGPLRRDGLSLHVIDLPSQAERLAWLARQLPQLPGTGIIYCLTVRDARAVAAYLHQPDAPVIAYSGDEDPEARIDAEQALLDGRVKALSATSALGMGFDKPDVAFVVHFQAPGSPVAYYQQVGRAGRALRESFGVLLRGSEDRDIQDWFIETAFPAEEPARAVLRLLEESESPRKVGQIEAAVNLKRGRLENLLKQLEVDGAVRYLARQGWERTLQPWTYPAARVEQVTAARRIEQAQMRAYALGDACRMAFLTGLLDDPDTGPCGVCDVCAGSRFDAPLDPADVEGAARFLRGRPLEIEPRRRWPVGVAAVRGTIKPAERLEDGRALCRWGDGGWARDVRQGKEVAGRFDDGLVEQPGDDGAQVGTTARTDVGDVRAVATQRAPRARSRPAGGRRAGAAVPRGPGADREPGAAEDDAEQRPAGAQRRRRLPRRRRGAERTGAAGGRHRRLPLDAHRRRTSAPPRRLRARVPRRVGQCGRMTS